MSELFSTDLTTRVLAIQAITARGTATLAEIDGLIACLGDDHKPVQRRAADALVAVEQGGTPVIARVRAALTASTLGHRWGAAYALARLGVGSVDELPILLDMLASDDGDRRWAAAQMVVALGATPTVLNALRAGLTASTAVARKMALYCLRDLRTPWNEGDIALVAGLRDGDAAVRLAALSAGVVLAVDRDAFADACAARLTDTDAGVCRAAAATLGKLGIASIPILDALRSAVTGPDTALTRAATAALERLGRA